MAILTESGRVVIAESLSLRAIHVAWGLGDGAWEAPPDELAGATVLQSELGRRTADEIAFVTPDPEGNIVRPEGNFSRSVTPTNHLYVVVRFEFTEAPSGVIREGGVFVGTVPVGGLPPGQNYFLPAEVANPGRLLHLENLAPIFRSPAIRESFDAVISF